ncbi:NADP-dependent oxidoreductase [Levilactobacillus bambusae]|uniref:Oxidoreductase n=1 Tax=Levilactobacillus bambusae TaxID=2024736 RepID=A0A2V1N1K8_9LACO|nr:NADP-dependent oxidoreductase [Levilactobacillus bambusae]PWG00265.1 oxidoreductase [Levilactobacillus bambusae]
MKAAQLDQYQTKFMLTVRDVEKPKLADNEVLIKVRYAAINPLDNLIGTGAVRTLQGATPPFTMGSELSGTIEAVSSGINAFRPGDQVYARLPLPRIGSFAEYVAVDQDVIDKVPEEFSMRTASAMPQVGLLAYQGLTDELAMQAGQTLFLSDATDNLAAVVIPMASAMGVTVITVGTGETKQHALNLGAKQVIDPGSTNFWEVLSNIDAVMESTGSDQVAHEMEILKRGGTLLSIVAGPDALLAANHDLSFWQRVTQSVRGREMDYKAKKLGINYRFIFTSADGYELSKISAMVKSHTMTPRVDPTSFSLDRINDALNYARGGLCQGSVIIKVAP